MASRIRPEAQLTFESLSIEGGLLSPEWLARVAQLGAGHQSEGDYRVPKGLSLRDEIGRYWRIAHAYWKEFAAGLEHPASGADDANRRRALTERFIASLLRDVFGFASLEAITPTVIDGRRYPIPMTALNGRVPVVVAAAGEGVESASATFGDGGRRRSPFGLAQEFLNAADGATWGVVADGHILRLLRDNASLTRPAWIQADLLRMFSEERYADFAALWLLAHESRFVASDTENNREAQCLLDTWRSAGQNEGTRAREDLRDGFREALLSLGQGFLAHPDNGTLRAALHGGVLTRAAYFQQLLRLVYRLIFLLTVEERDLLHPPDTSDETRRLYVAGYALRRLRDRSLKRNAHDRFTDLWAATTIVFRGLAGGEPRLGLPALAGLFSSNQCPDLDRARLENRALLSAMYRLAWLKQEAGVARVNWRDMGPEELGSVYESLLELQPQITQEGREFTFARAVEATGNARKTTGSYYTPDSLVQALLDSALEPVVANTIATNPQEPVESLLGLSIVDPACGSGHFLLAAARRLAVHVARLDGEGTPSAADYRRALRQVIARCIFGVDQNPMAVELCKVSLWMEAVEPGLPLTFLNSHIQEGNALLGTTPSLIEEGIPDTAWEPIEGDDRKVATALKKRHKAQAVGHRGLPFDGSDHTVRETREVQRAVAELETTADDNAAAVATKESGWARVLNSPEFIHQKFVADAWCAAFVWPKRSGDIADAAPTFERWRQIRGNDDRPPALTAQTVDALASEYSFFHWHLQFPQVWAKGGFDCVVGNPPWDEVQFEESAWFASSDAEVSLAPNAAERRELIDALETSNPTLYADYRSALRRVDGIKHFVVSSQVYEVGTSGKLNTSTLFATRSVRLAKVSGGAVGLVVPTGIATDKGASEVFADLMSKGRVRSLHDFVNRRLLFPAVRPHQHFCLFTVSEPSTPDRASQFSAFLEDPSQLQDLSRRYELTWDEILAINPEGRALLLFASSAQAAVSRLVCQQFSPLGVQNDQEDWRPAYQQGTFNTASASDLFRTAASLISEGYTIDALEATKAGAPSFVPLFDAKMARQFEWRAASLGFSGHQFRKVSKASSSLDQLRDPCFVSTCAYWVPSEEAESRLRDWRAPWVLGFKDVTGVTSTRLAAFAFVPRMGFGDVFPLLKLAADASGHAFVAAWLNSLLIEWLLRQRMQGLHLTWHILGQLPTPSRQTALGPTPWDPRVSLAAWVAGRVAELTCTSWHLSSLAEEILGAPVAFEFNPERRFALRLELDAAFFVLSGMETDDAIFVMDSLDKVAAREKSEFGKYRSRNEIPQIMAAMHESSKTGEAYTSDLDPAPADLSLAQRLPKCDL